MLERSESELQIVRSRVPLPTVEVDIDCIPEDLPGYDELVVNALAPIAANSPKMRATIYIYTCQSINFRQQTTWSAFFGVAGNRKLLDVILNVFRAAKVDNVRFSDSIDISTAEPDFHVQDGYVWRPYEFGAWYANSQGKKNLAEAGDAIVENDVLDLGAEVMDGGNSRISSPTRFRVARADATVGAIRRKIEEVFGLPKGSVALCGPDKKALRGDARIDTLRKRWE